MDWSKAKNIILIGLFLTNIFLLFQFVHHYNNMVKNTKSVNNYTISILEKNNISVECELPKNQQKLPPIIVNYSSLSNEEADHLCRNARPVKSSDRTCEGYGDAADQFLKENQMMHDSTRRESTTVRQDIYTVKYKNYYRNIPIEGSNMELTYYDGKLKEIKKSWLIPTDERERNINMISPLSALLSLMSEINTDKKTIINEIKLVYYVTPYEDDSTVLFDTAFPAWEIRYNDNQVKYISTIEQ